MIKSNSTSKNQMAEYLDNYCGATEHGSDWECSGNLIERLSNEIKAGAIKTVKKLAQELHGYSEEFVLPFTCSEDLY